MMGLFADKLNADKRFPRLAKRHELASYEMTKEEKHVRMFALLCHMAHTQEVDERYLEMCEEYKILRKELVGF